MDMDNELCQKLALSYLQGQDTSALTPESFFAKFCEVYSKMYEQNEQKRADDDDWIF